MRLLGCLALAASLLLAHAATAYAQNAGTPQTQTVSCQVLVTTRSGTVETRQVKYARFNTMPAAQVVRNQLKEAIREIDSDAAVERVMKASKADWRDSRENGTFSMQVLPGQPIVVLCDNAIVSIIETTAGQTSYTCTLVDETSLQTVTVTGEHVNHGIDIKPVPGIDTGGEVQFNINAFIPAGYVKKESRLIIQPMVIDCQTEDTVAYLTPMVYEAGEYHGLQDRRMRFDYDAHDPLAFAYHAGKPLVEGKPFAIDTMVVFKKPDPSRIYKGLYYCILEDYHHDYYNNGGQGTGSCLAFKPFKFLDFSVASVDLNLADFRVDAEAQFISVPRELKLTFVENSAELRSDSLNDKLLAQLTQEMKALGSKLAYINVEGGASPDGIYEKNYDLAGRRANFALRRISELLGKADVQKNSTAKVYTWEDVVTSLAENGTDSAVVSAVRGIVERTNSRAVVAELKKLPYFETTILPVLENQRIMRCTYLYENEHTMNADEAVAAYYGFKGDYITGKRHFSDGDYYNLFATITDSAEIDTITELAYREMVKRPSYEVMKFAPYVCNRMAMLNNRRGTPDLGVLAPFIDLNDFKISIRKMRSGQLVELNRPAIVINQAIAYFHEQKLDTAVTLVSAVPSSNVTEKLRKFIDFEDLYIKRMHGMCSPEEEQRCDEAYNYVINSSEENKAILYTELHSQLGFERKDVEPFVDKMHDNNPKKWYLKGILWSGEAGKEQEAGFNRLSDAEYMELMRTDHEAWEKYNEDLRRFEEAAGSGNDTIPHYLAYFQHSFDLEPKFRRYYFNEGNISDETRKKHPYRAADIEAYRRKFEQLYAVSQAAIVRKAVTDSEAGHEETQPSAADEAAEMEQEAHAADVATTVDGDGNDN